MECKGIINFGHIHKFGIQYGYVLNPSLSMKWLVVWCNLWKGTHVVISKFETTHVMNASTGLGRIELTHSFPENISHYIAC